MGLSILLLPVLVLLVLVVALRRLPASIPAGRFTLALRLIVAATVLAPAFVRCGPSHAELRPYVNSVVYWRDLADRVPASGGVILSDSWGGSNVEADIAYQDTFQKAVADDEAQRRRLNPTKDLLKWMRLPKPVSEAEVKSEADRALRSYEEEAAKMNAAGAYAVFLAVSALIGGIVLDRRAVSSGDTPKQTAENQQRLSKLALRGAGLAAGTSVLWTLTSVDWIPDFGLIVPVLSLVACGPLVRFGRRLRHADAALSAADPELLAEQRVRQHAASLQTRNAQLAADIDAATAIASDRTSYLASLRATAPGSPAVAAAEEAVAAAHAAVDALKVKQAAPADDFAGELRELQAAISEKRKHVAVLAAGGAPPEVIKSADAAIEELRQRFGDLADRASTGATPQTPSATG